MATPMTPTEYPYAINSWCVPRNTWQQDIEQCARIGAHAVGIWEQKFKDNEDDTIKEALAKHDIRAGIVLPRHWTILPTPLDPKGMPVGWKEKSLGICKSHRSARALQAGCDPGRLRCLRRSEQAARAGRACRRRPQDGG